MKSRRLIKIFVFCVIVCASVQAEEAAKVTVLSKDILKPLNSGGAKSGAAR